MFGFLVRHSWLYLQETAQMALFCYRFGPHSAASMTGINRRSPRNASNKLAVWARSKVVIGLRSTRGHRIGGVASEHFPATRQSAALNTVCMW
jgi:hypothetical protein